MSAAIAAQVAAQWLSCLGFLSSIPSSHVPVMLLWPFLTLNPYTVFAINISLWLSPPKRKQWSLTVPQDSEAPCQAL